MKKKKTRWRKDSVKSLAIIFELRRTKVRRESLICAIVRNTYITSKRNENVLHCTLLYKAEFVDSLY